MDVYVYYVGYDHGKDVELRKLARKFKGREGGAGFCFDSHERDVSFSFGRESNAKRFARAVRKHVKVRKVGHYADDGSGWKALGR